MAVLKTIDLTKHYKQGSNDIYAVNGVDLVVEQGQFIAITGASGSGKTTLLHLCAMIDKPTGGDVYIGERHVNTSTPDELAEMRCREIGIVFQQFNLIGMMTARENIIVPALLAKSLPGKDYFDELVRILGIEDRLEHLPSELSGGQIQRVAIARALINRPSIILADEPTGNLDRATSEEIVELFCELHRRGNTVVMVTHDAGIAARADVVYTMADGRLTRG